LPEQALEAKDGDNMRQKTFELADEPNGSHAIPGKQADWDYRVAPFSLERRMVAASAAVGRRQSNIQFLTEVDISQPRRLMRKFAEREGEKLSLTAYIIRCLAQAIVAHPHLNAFRKGNKLILLDEVTISAQVEREVAGELVPGPIGIQSVQRKTLRQIQQELRAAQEKSHSDYSELSGLGFLRFLPSFMYRFFIRVASRNVKMMTRYGAVGVTAVGMLGPKDQAMWLIPLVGGATVAVGVGGIITRPAMVDGMLEERERLCLTITFNHDIVDGAPAARFIKTFSGLLQTGELLNEMETEPRKRG
jgi:pyruvate/2-oxoglutarate dehydrogenase complex dihydrolipoamide acyltransferase (E2) component